MVKNLITGITGFVGSHLAEYLLNENEKVCGTYRWRSPRDNIKNIEGRLNLVPCELRDYASVLDCVENIKPDVIYHLAAQSYVKDSYGQAASTIETNVIGTINLLDVIKRLKKKDGYNPIIHICSSSEVYGQPLESEIPIKETNPLRPASPYALSKVGEDMAGLQYFLTDGLKTIRTRMFTHTGPRRGEVFVVSAFAKQIAQIEKGLQESIIKVGNLDSVRTFSDVRDAVRAYYLLVNKCEPGEVYNIGGNETMRVGDMLDRLIKFSNLKKIDILEDPNLIRPADVTLQIPCVDKFEKATGWRPEIPFSKTLRDTLDYWREKV
ncbi:MAG: GDP-mannose 4,6-dehydratase [Nanoarchaeota archaeon]|nr:GDP-mannose 4,6-dehydratase [Nanoarchaeota archaeon]